MRVIFWFLLCTGLPALSGQPLPSYLTDTFPAPNATGVPTNVNIILRNTVGLQPPPFVGTGFYTLKAGPTAAVSFANNFNCNCYGTVIAPAAALSPNTVYTFTVNPGSSVGPAYSFSFTTGAGPDNNPPHLVSIDPPPGTTSIGLIGPFQLHFDKRIARSTQNQAVVVRALPTYLSSYTIGTTVSADGTTVIVTLGLQQGYPVGFEVTVDPTQFADAFGNTGQGNSLVADYTTFITADASGPHLQSSLPPAGDSGVPTNVMPRLIFQKAVDATTLGSNLQVLADGVSQSITFSHDDIGTPNTGAFVTIQPAKLLAPNRSYTIVIGTGLRDANGFPLGQSQSIPFTTGPGPDVVAPAVLGTSPSDSPFPPNGQILIKTNKPISPIILSRLSSLGLEYGQVPNQPWPGSATLSPDGTLLTLSPATPFTPQYYGVLASEIFDASGAPFFISNGQSLTFNVSGSADNNPPALLAVNPPPNSTSVPLNSNIQVLFSEPCATCLFPNALTVSANGKVLPLRPSADYSGNNASFTFKPGSLGPSTTYTVSISGIQDLAGNAMADSSFSFTTAATPPGYAPVNLLSSSVNNGDTGVNPSGPFTFQYDSALNPVAAVTAATLQGPGGFVYPTLGIVSGSTLAITLVNPLPANTTFQLVVYVTALSGVTAQTKMAFTTAPGSDTTRPQVTNISPADGSAVRYGSAPFVLTFSKPLNPSTVTGSSLSIYIDGQIFAAMPVRSGDNRSVSVALPYLQANSFTVVASGAIQDLDGNSLTPFEATYQVQSTSSTNFIHEIRPAFGSTNVPANTPVTFFLDQPVDLAAINASLVALVNFSPVPGTFDLAGGGRILRFTSSNPFPAGSAVSFYERTPILGINSGYSYSQFTIAPAPPSSLQYVRSTMGSSGAVDSVFEIEFNHDPPLGQTISAFTFGTGNGGSTNVAFTESIPRPHVLRLTTTAPRQPGYYVVTLSNAVTGDINSPRYLYATLTTVPLSGRPTVASAGPVADSTAVPVNASARILFGAPINPLTVTAQSAVFSINGNAVSTQIAYPSNNQEIILRPLQAIPPNATVTVLLSGLQDLAGRPIPDSSWSFTAGSDPDFVGPSILYTSLPVVSDSGGVQIAANEAVQIVFSKPIDPGISVQAGYSNSSGLNNTASITLSPDLRVITIAPVTTWAVGQQYSIGLNYESDLEGNNPTSIAESGTYATKFTVAFSPIATPPQLLAVSPPDGSSGMPLNARIMVAFDRPITVLPGGITLTDTSGNVMPLERFYNYDDNNLAVFTPLRPLLPDTAYSLSLANATDLSGNPLTSPVTATFTTGETADLTGPVGTYEFVSPLPTNMPIRLRFNEPLSPGTTRPGRIQLLLGNLQVPVTAALSTDGASIIVTPQQPLIPGDTYNLRINSPTDFAGNPATFAASAGNSASATFVAGNTAVTAPPVISIFPLNGATGIPVNIQPSYQVNGAVVRVSFSTAADLLSSTPVLQVLQNGVPVSGSVSMVSTGMSFLPSSPFQYSTTYQVRVSGVVDFLGNAAAPVSSTFTTSDSANTDRARFSITSIQPADASAGVDNNTPIAVTFSKLLDPAVTFFTLSSSRGLLLNGKTTISGSTLTFTPAEPWPSGGTVSIQFFQQYPGASYFHDLSGTLLDKNYGFSFTAAVVPDATLPTLVSITPAAGTPISPGYDTFTLVFSKPVVIGSNGLQALIGTQSTSVDSYYAQSSSHIISASISASPDNVLTIVGTTGIQDANGNSITPFTFTYPTLHTNQSDFPSVSSISPTSFATGVQPSTPIKIAFNKPMEPGSLLSSVLVTQNGVLIPGQLQVMDSNQSVQFTPNAQYLPGTRIDVFVLTTATDPNGAPMYQQYQAFFTVAGTTGQPAAVQSMSISMAGFGETIDPDAGLDLTFDHDLEPGSASDQNVWLRLGHTRIPGTLALRDSRTLRFQPAAPLTIGAAYVLTAGPGLRSIEGFFNRPRELRVRAEPAEPVRIESVEYLRGPAPLAIRVRFSGPVSPISSGALKLLAADGSEVRTSIRPSTDGREWLLLLDSPRSVRVVFEGVQDQWGRTLPRESREPVVVQ